MNMHQSLNEIAQAARAVEECRAVESAIIRKFEEEIGPVRLRLIHLTTALETTVKNAYRQLPK